MYFAAEMLKTRKESLEGKLCLVSGSGNVAPVHGGEAARPGSEAGHTVRLGRRNLRSRRHRSLARVMDLKNARRGRIRQYVDTFKKAIFMPADTKLDHNPLWNIKADCAFPSATQNEVTAKDAANLCKNGVKVVAEGANMPCTLEATKCSWTPRSSKDRARPRTPAVRQPPVLRWPTTAPG